MGLAPAWFECHSSQAGQATLPDLQLVQLEYLLAALQLPDLIRGRIE